MFFQPNIAVCRSLINHVGVQELAILLRILEFLFSDLSQKTCCAYRRLWVFLSEDYTECSAQDVPKFRVSLYESFLF